VISHGVRSLAQANRGAHAVLPVQIRQMRRTLLSATLPLTSMVLYRRTGPNFQTLEYKCHAMAPSSTN